MLVINAAMSLNEFRRRFFSGTNRPSKFEVVDWIEGGTVEGRRLKAICLNGRYYIRENDALESLNPGDPPRKTPASKRLEEQQARIREARHLLRTKYGFKL